MKITPFSTYPTESFLKALKPQSEKVSGFEQVPDQLELSQTALKMAANLIENPNQNPDHDHMPYKKAVTKVISINVPPPSTDSIINDHPPPVNDPGNG